MAAWTGTKTITAGATGTATAATANTLTNSGASFPGSNGLANFTIRTLTGTGSGQTRTISSNTATQVTVSSNWSVTPSTDTTYEIVLLLIDQDTVTGNLVFSTNIIAEVANNATIFVTGNFSITFGAVLESRFNKSASTMPTFCFQNRSTTGTGSSWAGIRNNNALTVAPNISYIKIQDASPALLVDGSASGIGDGSAIHHIWMDSCGNTIQFSNNNQTQNQTIANIFCSSISNNGKITVGTSTANLMTVQKYWIQDCESTGLASTNNSHNFTFDQCVFRDRTYSSKLDNQITNIVFIMQDCYWQSGKASYILGQGIGTAAGTQKATRCVLYHAGTFWQASTAGSTMTCTSLFNDAHGGPTTGQFMNYTASTLTAATSDNDYISGTNNASVGNVDTTNNATTSTATPNQFKNLTSNRTNAKSSPNRPYTLDNVSVGTPTSSQVTITFDCTNGAVSGQGSSTVTSDSNSGQAVVNTTTTTGFEVGETIEIGYGTARYETGIIQSISAGASVTLTTNLVYTHTAAQADTIKKRLRHTAIPFIRYGTATGNYNKETPLPPFNIWGLIYTGINTTYNGQTYAFSFVGHSITLANLKPGTTYFYQPCAYDPLGNLLTGSEGSFTTSGVTTAFTFGG